MPTQTRGRQIKDDDVGREDINVTTIGRALATKVQAGTNIGISYTGADVGTGDVTVGLSGVVGVGNGGTGVNTLTGVVIGNATSAFTSVAGTSNQVLRRNTANTAYEFYTLPASVLGTIAAGQVAFGTAANTIGGDTDFTFNSTTNLLTLGGGITLTGARTIQTSTGNLTLATAAGNGNIVLSPNGTGNVGIRTTTPQAPLHIIAASASDNALIQEWSYTSATIDQYSLMLKQTVSSGIVKYNFSMVNNNVAFDNVLVLDRGNVGIGTASPAFTLDVNGTGRFSGQLTASTTAGGTSAIFQNTGAQNANGIELRGGTGGTAVNWKIEKDNTVNNAFQLTPSTTNGGTTYTTPVLTIASTGAATFSSSVTANGGLISNGGSIGYGGGELGFNVTTSGATSGIYTTATGSPILYFDHRATGNTGFWVWRSGTGGGTIALTLSNAGAATFSSTARVEGQFLQVVNASAPSVYLNNVTVQWRSYLPSSNNYAFSDAVRDVLTLGYNGSPSFFQGCNVGIGTASPSTKLDVRISDATTYTTSSTGNTLTLYNTSTTTNSFVGIDFIGEPTSGNAGRAAINMITVGSGNGDLAFSTRGSSVLGERMRITASGNVLIGKQMDEGHKLQVAGGALTALRLDADSGVPALSIGSGATISVDSPGVSGGRFLLNSTGNVGIGTTSINHRLQVAPLATFGNAEDGNICISTIQSGGTATSPTTTGGIIFGDNTVVNAYMGRIAVIQDNPFNSTASHMRFYTNSGGGNGSTTEKLRITASGNVLIGTQTDNGERLQVEDNGNNPLLISTSSTTLFTTYRSNSVVVGYIGNGQGMINGGGVTNFGIRAENDLNFLSGGANTIMQIRASGNVLIGLAGDNGGKLRVKDITNKYAVSFERWNSSITLGGFFQNSGSSGEMILNDTNGSQNVLISSSGNSYWNAPSARFSIGTNVNTTDLFRVNGTTFSNDIMTWNPQNDNRSGIAWRFGEATIASVTPNRRLRVNVGGIEYYIGAMEV
jgi:hypothetical protein